MKTLIKICGITSVQDAELAIEAGADFIGLIFVPETPRYIDTETAKEIVSAINGQVPVVGVFQNPDEEDIQSILDQVPLDYIQLHGQETPQQCQKLNRPVIKTVSILETLDTENVQSYLSIDQVEYILIDRPKDQSSLSLLDIPEDQLATIRNHRPILLAGGVTPDNVIVLLERFMPHGIDVASGVESAPGRKDPQKMINLCSTIRHFDLKKGVG